MRVKDLIAALKSMDPEAKVRLSVGWAADTAIASDEAGIQVEPDPMDSAAVRVSGWLENCRTELEFDGPTYGLSP